MNNFNQIFLAVKKHCSDGCSEDGRFYNISETANVPIEKLDFYLSTLQDLGLIKYSWKNQTIHLTNFGKKQQRLFA
jgi:hypothetical protein